MADGKKGGFGIFSWFGRKKHDAQDTTATAPTGQSGIAPPSSSASKADAPACPTCGAAMYQRFDLQTRQLQWGCINYPACKGRRAL